MKFFTWSNVRLLLIFSLAIFLFAFSSKRNSDRKIKKAEVLFQQREEPFLQAEAVNKLLIEKSGASGSVAKEKLDLNKLENAVNAHKMVENAQVFITVDGTLKALVKQKTPVARVFDQSGSFYIDYDGQQMPLSEVHTARVPLVTSVDGVSDYKDIARVLQMVYEDEFLKKNIIGMRIQPSGSLVMDNRNFGYEIDFGKPVNIETKFRNYKAFFQKASKDSTIRKYKKISLRFTQQVVCTK